ncbi:animal hem peroxidase [Necator americanus]|uniref:Animal hem peroxidase n=1 Tax=Necator americanus TaxID=51031 RepID=W2T705_NECAM|nr:animal hem peroxidase [Necator americanus]ETN76951.1 animal hem peroxidase [Necator americanus]
MAPKRESLDIARTAGVLREATRVLVFGTGLDESEKIPEGLDVATLQQLLPDIEVEKIVGNFTPFLGREPLPKEQCLPQLLPCDHTAKYRTYSGWCNNLQFPKYGNAFTGMRRLLDPAYGDGFDAPRTRARSGFDLPSARAISNSVHQDSPEFHVKFTHMLMQFGQILDHDMMHSPIARVYGSTDCEANQLRLFSQGKLNYTDLGFNKEALPQGNQERDCRSTLSSREKSNEQPGLTVVHTILLREHNRIASELRRVNNFWTDEQLYQEARRINVAKIQHVIFKEWLPVVLGCEAMSKYDLMPKKSGYFTGYDPHCDPAISQEMSTSAFRFGHTLIRSKFPRMNDIFKNMTDAIELKDHFGNPSPLYDHKVGHMESMLMGLVGAERCQI